MTAPRVTSPNTSTTRVRGSQRKNQEGTLRRSAADDRGKKGDGPKEGKKEEESPTVMSTSTAVATDSRARTRTHTNNTCARARTPHSKSVLATIATSSSGALFFSTAPYTGVAANQ